MHQVKTQDATVFDISDKGFTNVSGDFPNIPTVEEKWYKEDGYWKYRLKRWSDGYWLARYCWCYIFL